MPENIKQLATKTIKCSNIQSCVIERTVRYVLKTISNRKQKCAIDVISLFLQTKKIIIIGLGLSQ